MKKLCLALLVLLALGGRAQAEYCWMVGCTNWVGFVLLDVPGLEADPHLAYEVAVPPDVNSEVTFAKQKILYGIENAMEEVKTGSVGLATVMVEETTVKVLGYQWLMSPDGKHDNLFMLVQVVHQPEE